MSAFFCWWNNKIFSKCVNNFKALINRSAWKKVDKNLKTEKLVNYGLAWYSSGIQLPEGFKYGENWKSKHDVINYHNSITVVTFRRRHIWFLMYSSFWSKFHVIIVLAPHKIWSFLLTISRDFFTLTKEILNGELHFWVVFAFGPFPQIPDIW